MAPDVDVLIIGAGISGIGAAAHLTRKQPDKSYLILEARDAIGGTWDLFRYPGIRSDSDLQTFCYAFRPWLEERAIAEGPAILRYIRETATEYGIEGHIRFGHKVRAAEWSTADACWTVDIFQGEAPKDGMMDDRPTFLESLEKLRRRKPASVHFCHDNRTWHR